MDASNRLAAVFGERAIDIETMTAEERWETFERVLQGCGPQLRYFHDFRELRHHYSLSEHATGSDGRLRCLALGPLENDKISIENGVRIRERSLFLTQEGRLGVATVLSRYQEKEGSTPGSKTSDVTFESFVFNHVLFGDNGSVFSPATLAKALREMSRALESTVRQREEHLRKLCFLDGGLYRSLRALHFHGGMIVTPR